MLTFADASRQVRIASIAYSETLRIIALIRKTTPTLSQLKLIIKLCQWPGCEARQTCR